MRKQTIRWQLLSQGTLHSDEEGLRRGCPALPGGAALEDTFPEQRALLQMGSWETREW